MMFLLPFLVFINLKFTPSYHWFLVGFVWELTWVVFSLVKSIGFRIYRLWKSLGAKED
jgi:hypothetical protein